MSKLKTYGAQTPKCSYKNLTNTDFCYRLCDTLHCVLMNFEECIDLRTRDLTCNLNIERGIQDIRAILDKSTSINEPKPPESEEDSPSFKCPLCLVNLHHREPMSTRCGHIFCGKCIETALKFAQKCPVCQKRLLRKHIFRIYL